MLKQIIFKNKVKYEDLLKVTLPFSFQFIYEHQGGILYAIGLTSTYKDITWNELKMVAEGFE